MSDSIAHYRIGAKLGQGGMGEVYRATDTKLGREVAVKIIAPSLAQDATRMASFRREAQVLASLNHPNIAAIYGVEDQALVMELVDGPTLAERIKDGPLPLDEALAIARQIVDALAAAHDKGIVHRDLKPANIKITPEGVVKLLDFGLAKAAAGAGVGVDEAMTVALTMSSSGLIVGTPGYMAPEQARGLPVDKRADIWAFGVVLYEMLAGAALFHGETTTDVMAAVVREEPDLTRVPARVRPLLRRCLEKDPKRRLRDIGDAMLLLDLPAEAAGGEASAPAARRSRMWAAWGTAAVLGVALAALAAVHFRETAPAASPVRFHFRLPEGVTFTQTAPFAVSPDGRHLAFPAVGEDGVPRLWIHSFSELAPRPLTAIQPNPLTIAWSPDSRQLLFSHDGRVKRVALEGGPAQTVHDAPGGALLGAAWFPDGTIVFGAGDGIVKTTASGGTPEPLTNADTAAGEVHMVFGTLPDGRFLYTRGGAPGTRAIYVGSVTATVDEQDTTPMLTADLGALYVPGPDASREGHLLFTRDSTLMAQRFDAGAGQLLGDPAPLATQVFSFMGGTLGAAFVSASSEGSLVYRTGSSTDLARQLVWFSRDGKPLDTVGSRARYQQMRLSPDASRLVASQIDINAGIGTNPDIWITDLVSQTSARLTFAAGVHAQPTWSSDGRFIAWAAIRNDIRGIYRKPADGSGEDELLYRFPENAPGNVILADWSSDGFLVFARGGDIFALPMEGTPETRQPIPIVETPATEYGPDLSPDSRWLVYISNESGRQELFVQPFAAAERRSGTAPGGKWMVSNNGTLGLARWRADGRELLFVSGDGTLMSIDVEAASVFKASAPRALFQLPRPFLVQTLSPGTLADVAQDGQRLLLAMPSEEATRPELSVVLNWQALLAP